MSIERLHRHDRLRIDAAAHRAFSSLLVPEARTAFAHLLALARSRSDVMHVRPRRAGACLQVEALRNLADFVWRFRRDPETWPGAVGHPLQVVDSLACHLLADHPTPRFLASVWFGGDTDHERERRLWFLEHSRGRRFRSLSLPIPMTRHMEHVFLQTPDHLSVDHALRRAEVMGLGGSEALATSVIATQVGKSFEHPDFWRRALEWMVRWEGQLDLAQVGPIVDYVQAIRFTTALVDTPAGPTTRPPPRPDFELRGRTVTSLLRDVAAWHAEAGLHAASMSWAPSRWRGLLYEVGLPDDEGRRVEWSVVELLNSTQLLSEGQAMHHCVATYAGKCARGASAIWSLRRRHGADGAARPVLTIEVDPREATIKQIRGPANRRAHGQPLELVRMWAARERLGLSREVEQDLAGAVG